MQAPVTQNEPGNASFIFKQRRFHSVHHPAPGSIARLSSYATI